MIIFDNFARLLKRVPEPLELIRLTNEFFQKLETIALNVPCAIILKNDVVFNFDKKYHTIKNKKKKMKKVAVMIAWKHKSIWVSRRRNFRSKLRYMSALGKTYFCRISQSLFLRARKRNKATIRITRNINNCRGLAKRNPMIVPAHFKPFYGDSYKFCD